MAVAEDGGGTAPVEKPVASAVEEKLPLQFCYVYPLWQEARDFKRISEYFTGQENMGGNIVLRTDPAERAGLYFRIGLPLGASFPKGSRGVIEYLRSDSPELFSQAFVLPESPARPLAELRLGLTGKAYWPGKNLKLVAWRFTLKDDTGRVLAQEQSYLWGFPEESLARSKTGKLGN